MFLLSLSWSQGWVDFTCTDSCSETLRLLYVLSCACFSLHIIGNCFIYHSCCNRFIWIVYFICICGRKLIPSSRCTPSIHQSAQPPISFLPGWMSISHYCGCSLQWIFVSQNSIVSMMFLELLLHSMWWSLDLYLLLKMSYFQISILDSKLIPDLYHTSFSIPLPRYTISTFICLMFWMVWQNPF